MYISSDGTQKDVKTLNTEYLINALAKSLREIYNSTNEEEYDKYSTNIEVLEKELWERQSTFLTNKLDEWEEK